MAIKQNDTDKEYYESKMNYRNMIQNLADMYPFDIDEVVLVECVANSLDARSSEIQIDFDIKKKSLTISDNGNGMTKSQFRQYHDFAMALKRRGEGIGFAGLGAKLSFNIAHRVVTQTQSKSFTGGSDWTFKQEDLIWKPIRANRVKTNGTRVEILFNKKSDLSYKNADDIKDILFRHYAPLFEKEFLEFYNVVQCYKESPQFVVNGTPIKPVDFIERYQAVKYARKVIKTARGKPLGYAIFGLVPEATELNPPGILLCTWGKVVKPDFLNQFPGALMSRIFGIAEIPNFIKFLTTSKSDFNRTKNRAEFNIYYGPLRDSFVGWLKDLGIDSGEEQKEEESRAVERELTRIISSIPEISELMQRRESKKIPIPSKKGEDPVTEVKGSPTLPVGEGSSTGGEGIAEPDSLGNDEAYIHDEDGKKRGRNISRRGRTGPKIAFRNLPEKEEMGWVDNNIIFINSGHPGYIKTSTNKKGRLIFNLITVAIALQRYIAEGDEEVNLSFIDSFMYAWGK